MGLVLATAASNQKVVVDFILANVQALPQYFPEPRARA
jgi:hypothetical protein